MYTTLILIALGDNKHILHNRRDSFFTVTLIEVNSELDVEMYATGPFKSIFDVVTRLFCVTVPTSYH